MTVDVFAIASALVFVALVMLWSFTKIVGPAEVHWPAPTIVNGDTAPEHLPPSHGVRISNGDLEFLAYIPLQETTEVPPLYKFVSNGSYFPNPELKEFREKYPPVRRLWKHGPVWSEQRLMEHVLRNKLSHKDSYLFGSFTPLNITAEERV